MEKRKREKKERYTNYQDDWSGEGRRATRIPAGDAS